MTPKSFPSVPTRRPRAAGWLLLLATLCAAGAPSGRAQEPTASPSPSATPKLAYIRFWNMLPSQPPKVLELLSADKSLITAPICNFYTGYSAVTPGSFNLTVRRVGDEKGAIKRFPVNLKADQYVTILASNKDGQPGVEYIEDTVDPKLSAPRRLTLRQLFPDAKVTATIDNAPPTAPLGYGDTVALDSLPASAASLTIQATIAGKGVKSWSMPLDLSKYPHSTVLIFPDPYGRFRPRLTIDGQSVDGGVSADR